MIQLSDKEKVEFTKNSKTVKNGNKFVDTIYSTVSFVEEDGIWKPVREAKSLKNSGIDCKIIKSDNEHIIDILDWNLTSMKLKLSKKTKGTAPLIVLKRVNIPPENKIKDGIELNKIEYIEKSRTDYYFDDEKDYKTIVVEATIGDIVRFGENSTEVTLQPPSVDIRLRSGTYQYGCQIKWDISSIPSGKQIDSATLKLYIEALSSPGYTNPANTWRVDDQTWSGTSDASYINSQTVDNHNERDFSSTTLHTWSDLDVTEIVKADYDDGHTYSSLRFDQKDHPLGTINVVRDAGEYNQCGAWLGGSKYTVIYFASNDVNSGDEYRPKLVIEYSDAPIIKKKLNSVFFGTNM